MYYSFVCLEWLHYYTFLVYMYVCFFQIIVFLVSLQLGNEWNKCPFLLFYNSSSDLFSTHFHLVYVVMYLQQKIKHLSSL